MRLIVIGISHKTAPVEVRERFSFTKKALRESLAKFKRSDFVSGTVILSTCNRIEIYFHIKDVCVDFEKIKSFIFEIFCAGKDDIARYFYIFKDEDAARHLFRVASGLDSQVLGENQILAQVRSAWVVAKEEETSSADLDEIFEKAEEAGRWVRLETKVSQGNISIGSVAIKMLKSRLKTLERRSALIIGASKIGALIGKYLKEENMKGIFVASRTYARALELASLCGGRAADLANLEEEIRDVDIVISSTSSPHIILKKGLLVKIMHTGRKPLLIMDLAVPRDVDPGARDVEGVSLYDLDDLKYIVEDNYKNREREAVFAERLVEIEARRFMYKEAQILSRQET